VFSFSSLFEVHTGIEQVMCMGFFLGLEDGGVLCFDRGH